MTSDGALLLVHGFPLDARMWGAQVAALSDLRRVVPPDLNGRGTRRDRPPSVDVDGMARQLAAELDAEGIDAVDLGGFSMGGYVCFAFWRLFPSRVRSLTLVDTRAGADTEAGRQGRDAMAAETRARGAVVAADAMVPKLLSPAAPAALSDEVRGWIMEMPSEAIVADLQALKSRPDSPPDLVGISVPTLIVVGSEEVITPPAEAQAMVAAIPGARLETVAGAGHLTPVERPEGVSAAMRAFLTSG